MPETVSTLDQGDAHERAVIKRDSAATVIAQQLCDAGVMRGCIYVAPIQNADVDARVWQH